MEFNDEAVDAFMGDFLNLIEAHKALDPRIVSHLLIHQAVEIAMYCAPSEVSALRALHESFAASIKGNSKKVIDESRL